MLRVFTLIVACFGVAGALMAVALERGRELATLRALGATPAQVAEIALLETGVLGALAGALAVPLGALLATVLVFVINQRSFGWTMPILFDARTLATAPLLGAAAGVVSGLFPAWRAARTSPRGGAARRMNRLGMLALSALALAACGGGSSRPAAVPAPPAAGRLSLPALLSDAAGQDPDDGFERALAPRPFVFPDDDGPHPGFRSEWWYFTGVLHAPGAGGAARRFGYEMTIFRQALSPRLPARASAWATRDVYMGHFAITDVDGAGGARRLHAYERFARDGLALAGARARPFAVWVDDWRMQGPDAADRSMPVHLSARRRRRGDRSGRRCVRRRRRSRRCR